MKKLLVLFIVVISAIPMLSQNSFYQNEDSISTANWGKMHHRLGLYGSFMSGAGLAYQYQFDNGVSLKLQGIALSLDNNDDYPYNGYDYDDNDNKDLVAEIGADIQFNLHKQGNMRYYAMIGAMYSYYETAIYGNYYYYDSQQDIYDTYSGVNIGTGVGMEYKLFSDFDLSVVAEVGLFARFARDEEYNPKSINGEYVLIQEVKKSKMFSFGVGIGAFYAF